MKIPHFIGMSPRGGLAGACLLLAGLFCGCGEAPSEACRAYVACQQAYDEATGAAPADVTQYEAGGACWDSGANASACSEDCEAGVAALRDAALSEGIDLPACQTP